MDVFNIFYILVLFILFFKFNYIKIVILPCELAEIKQVYIYKCVFNIYIFSINIHIY